MVALFIYESRVTDCTTYIRKEANRVRYLLFRGCPSGPTSIQNTVRERGAVSFLW